MKDAWNHPQQNFIYLPSAADIRGIPPIEVKRTGCDTYVISLVGNAKSHIYYGYDDTGGVIVQNMFQPLSITANVIIDPIYTNAGGEVTISETGSFEISYHIQFQSNGHCCSERSSITGLVELDTGGGFLPLVGSASSCYLREEAGDIVCPGLGKTIMVNITSGDKIRVVYSRVIGTTAAVTRTGESSLAIKGV